MTEELLSREDRMRLITIREDYLDVFRRKPELRIEKPAVWYEVVDQFEGVTHRLEDDEVRVTLLTTTRKLDDNGQLLIKKLDGTEHPLGEWEMADG